MRKRVESDPAERVSGIVALVESNDSVGVFVRYHGEDQHRERENEVTELAFQTACPLG